MSVTSDFIVELINAWYSGMVSANRKSVSGSATLQNAGVVAMSNVNGDYSQSGTTGVFIFSGTFSISADDVLTALSFSITDTYNNISFTYTITGSRNLTAGTYIAVAQVTYQVQSLSVTAP